MGVCCKIGSGEPKGQEPVCSPSLPRQRAELVLALVRRAVELGLCSPVEGRRLQSRLAEKCAAAGAVPAGGRRARRVRAR
jgi:hypothetical protein